MSYQNFSKMVNNETKSIRYENIINLLKLKRYEFFVHIFLQIKNT